MKKLHGTSTAFHSLDIFRKLQKLAQQQIQWAEPTLPSQQTPLRRGLY